jgi:hypothetical protein
MEVDALNLQEFQTRLADSSGIEQIRSCDPHANLVHDVGLDSIDTVVLVACLALIADRDVDSVDGNWTRPWSIATLYEMSIL